MSADFDIQSYLRSMRQEVREDLQDIRAEMRAGHTQLQSSQGDLGDRVDNALATLNNHGTRLVVVENAQKMVKWFAGTAIVTALGLLADFIRKHI